MRRPDPWAQAGLGRVKSLKNKYNPGQHSSVFTLQVQSFSFCLLLFFPSPLIVCCIQVKCTLIYYTQTISASTSESAMGSARAALQPFRVERCSLKRRAVMKMRLFSGMEDKFWLSLNIFTDQSPLCISHRDTRAVEGSSAAVVFARRRLLLFKRTGSNRLSGVSSIFFFQFEKRDSHLFSIKTGSERQKLRQHRTDVWWDSEP